MSTFPVALQADLSIRKVTVSLTNAEIKALPATPKVIVAAPAAGFMIMPIAALLVVDCSAGEYGDVIESLGNVDGFLAFSTDLTESAHEALNVLGNLAASEVLGLALSGLVRFSISQNGFSATASMAEALELDRYDGLGLSFGFAARVSTDPLVGGHADNSIKVVLYYDVVSIA